MFENAISTDTLRGLKKLGESKILGKAFLAGGTALALRFGHRLSYDLDFFTPTPFEELELVPQLKSIGEFELERSGWRTVIGTFEKMKFSIFFYEYPLITKTEDFYGVPIVDLPDLSAMKLQAIGDRGTRRDFVDLYFLKDHFSLKQMFVYYDMKFGKVAARTYHVLKGLQYFVDAEKQDMPVMLKPIDWEELKKYFYTETDKLSRQWVLV